MSKRSAAKSILSIAAMLLVFAGLAQTGAGDSMRAPRYFSDTAVNGKVEIEAVFLGGVMT